MTKPTTAFERLIACCQSLAEDTMCGVEDEVFADARQEQAELVQANIDLTARILAMRKEQAELVAVIRKALEDCETEDEYGETARLRSGIKSSMREIISRFPTHQ